MKKLVALLLSLCLLFGMMAFASAEDKTGTAQGFGSEVKVTVTVEDGKITALDVDDSGETYPSAGFNRADTVEKLIGAIVAAGTVDGVDTVAGATVTQKAVLEAVNEYIAAFRQYPGNNILDQAALFLEIMTQDDETLGLYLAMGYGSGNMLYRKWPDALKGRMPDAYVASFAACSEMFEEAAYSDHPMEERQREQMLCLLEETEKCMKAEAGWKQRLHLMFGECLWI